DLHAVGLQEFMNRVIGVFQVRKLPRPRRAHLAAGGRESFGDPVIAEGTFLRGFRLWVDEAAPIRARLYAIAAAEAVFLVDQNRTVRTNECRAHGTHLRARRIGALIAHLGNEKVLAPGLLGGRETVLASVRRVDLGIFEIPLRDLIALHP